MISNQTKGFTIIEKKRFARNFFAQGIGLTWRFKTPDFGLIFPIKRERRLDLTMWFVFFPIDVLFLDKNKKIVEIKKDFKPFTNYFPKNKANFVIEFPTGVLRNTKVGDVLSF